MGTMVSNAVIKLDTGNNWTVAAAGNISQVIGVYFNATLDANTRAGWM